MKVTEILQKSEQINSLKINLSISAMDVHLFEFSTSDSEEDEEKDDIRERVINHRAMDLFLETDLLEPLRKLINVRSISIVFDMISIFDGSPYVAPPRHGAFVPSIQATVESNWRLHNQGKA